jgi:NADH-quinone oxidoreductase subunit G
LSTVVGTVDETPFKNAIGDFYLTNPIARASRTMAECSAQAEAHARQAAE